MCLIEDKGALLNSRDHSEEMRRTAFFFFLPQCIQKTQPSPVLLTVGWGKNGMGSLQDPVLDLHGPHLDQPICLIMNEWIQSVSKQPWSPRCRHTRTMHPTKRPSKLKKSLNCKEGGNIKATEKRKRRGARQDL